MVERVEEQSQVISQREEQISNMAKTIEKLQAQLASLPQQEETKEGEPRGSIQIEIIEAKLDRSTEYFGKQDPFAELSIRM